MIKLLIAILKDQMGGTLAITRKTANTLITAAGFNANYAEIEAVVNGDIDATNIEDDAVGKAKLASDVVRTDYGLVQHTDGALYVDLSDTTPGLELTNGGLRVKAYGLNQRTSNGLEVGRAGDLLLSSSSTTPDGWSDVSSTYADKFIRISATALSTGGVNTHTHTASGTFAAHTHTLDVGDKGGDLSDGVQSDGTYMWNEGADTYYGNTVKITTVSGGGGNITASITTGDNVPTYVTCKMYSKS